MQNDPSFFTSHPDMSLSISSFPSLLTYLILVSSLLLNPCPSSSTQTPIRLRLKHVDSGQHFTKMELLQRGIQRSKTRLQRFSSMEASSSLRTNGSSSIKAPIHVGSGEFLVNLSIGTPPLPFTAIMDTGSDLIWTQSNPCTKCFPQPDPIFNPAKSTTFSNLSCSSDFCTDVNIFKCEDGCKYVYTYGDDSSTQGLMGTDTLTFVDCYGKPVSVPNIGFGCGVINEGTGLAQGSGIVGLGRGPLSLVSQLGVQKFSYCLTSIGENRNSSLLLGDVPDFNISSTSTNQITPLVKNLGQPSFYYLSLEGISVGETLLPIPKSKFDLEEDGSGGMIIDSGTTITYLQQDAFEMVKKEFSSQIRLRVSHSGSTGLDLCFDLPSNTEELVVPKMKFHFKGVDLELPAENYIIADQRTGVVCLAMGASGSISIFGNIQQQNLLVVHDLEKETVSFIPTHCDQL